MELVNQPGRLSKIYPLLDSSTIQHSFEIMNDRRKYENLRELGFWTADSAVYRIEKDRFSGIKECVLYLSRRQHNPFFKNFDKSIISLQQEKVYRPSKEEMSSIYDSVNKDTLRIRLSDLRLKKTRQPINCLKIFPNKLNKLNETQLSLVQFAYGQDNDLIKNMEMLYNYGIKKTYINILSPIQIQRNIELQGVEGSDSISHLCSISEISRGSLFRTNCSSVGKYSSSYLRGVLLPKEAKEQRTHLTSYDDALDYLLNDPEETLQNMCDASASRLLKLVSQYYEK